MARQCPRCKATVPDWRLGCAECGQRLPEPAKKRGRLGRYVDLIRKIRARRRAEVWARKEGRVIDPADARPYWAIDGPRQIGQVAIFIGSIAFLVSIVLVMESLGDRGVDVFFGGIGLIWAGTLTVAVSHGVRCLFDINDTLNSREDGDKLTD